MNYEMWELWKVLPGQYIPTAFLNICYKYGINQDMDFNIPERCVFRLFPDLIGDLLLGMRSICLAGLLNVNGIETFSVAVNLFAYLMSRSTLAAVAACH